MEKQTKYLVLLSAFFIVFLLDSCNRQQTGSSKASSADSLINAAYQDHDYKRLLELTERLDSTGELSDKKANYWRGYAFWAQKKMRLAENYWKKGIENGIKNHEDLVYYSKSANRLSSICLMRGDYETTLRVALEAVKKMSDAYYSDNSDYAFLLVTIGCCHLKMGNEQEAKENFEQSYQKSLKTVNAKNSTNNYTSTIASTITITDSYLYEKKYQEAYDWTGRIESMLEQYKQLDNTNDEYLDKQQSRILLYRACALEGLGRYTEAAKSYNEALKTKYAQTSQGRLEATTYLMSAKRWQEAANNFEVLGSLLKTYNTDISLDIISRYILPKFKSNLSAHRTDSALAIAHRLCNVLDSAISKNKKDDAIELATMYNTQQKESLIAQQQVDLSQQRYLATIIALGLIIISSVLIIYNRHQASMRLEKAFQELEVANERAEESSRMKTAFIQQISHEIRTPLNILSGFTQVITTPDMKLDEETKADINKKIIENTTRITELVNKMLELSDVNSRAVIDANDNVLAILIAAQACEDSGISSATHIKFDMKFDNDMESTMITTNSQQATRALSLLLDNAQKYTKEGEVLLSVTHDEKVVSFIIQDTGIGIPLSEKEHIFQEFVQLDEYNEGTGIGLTVARSICRRLGGNVTLDTAYTQGARFIMTLPVTNDSRC